MNFHPLTGGAASTAGAAAPAAVPGDNGGAVRSSTLVTTAPGTPVYQTLQASDPAQALPQASLPAGELVYETTDVPSGAGCVAYNDDPNGATSLLMSSDVEFRLWCRDFTDLWADMTQNGQPLGGSAPGAIQTSTGMGEPGLAAKAADGCLIEVLSTPKVDPAAEAALLARVYDTEATSPTHPPI